MLEGRVKVYTISYRGDEAILYIHRPPDIFPISQALTPVTSGYVYEADSEALIQKAPIEDIRRFLASHPTATLALLKQSYQSIDHLLERQALLMTGSAKRKLLFELVIHCRHSNSTPEGDYHELDIHETELAARTGLSRETINREIQKLKREGIVALNHHQIIVPRVSRLKQKLMHSA